MACKQNLEQRGKEQLNIHEAPHVLVGMADRQERTRLYGNRSLGSTIKFAMPVSSYLDEF